MTQEGRSEYKGQQHFLPKAKAVVLVDGVEGRSSSGQLACTQKGPALGRKTAADADREGKKRVRRERKERKEGKGGGRKGRRGGGREREERDYYFKI